MAEFISNSAILRWIRPETVLTVALNSGSGRQKRQTSTQTLPLTERARLPAPECNKIGNFVTRRSVVANLQSAMMLAFAKWERTWFVYAP